MTTREIVIINGLQELHGSSETMRLISDAIALMKEKQAEIERLNELLKEQEARIRELEEELRALKYGDQDTLKNAMMPAT